MTKRILAMIFLLGALPPWIAPPPVTAEERPQDKTARQWIDRLEKIDRWLTTGHWNRAEQALGKLIEEMAILMTGDNARQVLARAVTYRALANAGLGRGEEALWYWRIAQNLDPELRRGARFPSSYGAAGIFLKERPLRRAGAMPPGLAAPEAASRGDGDLTLPGPLSVPEPLAPLGLARRGWYTDRFQVEVLVDATGRIRSPVVLEGELPGKIYLGLEALRTWRFTPARSGGEPVDALLTLTDFTVPPATPDQPQQPPDGPRYVGGDVRRPIKISAPQPEYSPAAREAGVQGVVIVQALIDRDGRVKDLKVLKGLPMGLTEKALEAMSRWQFKPATLHGSPVAVYYNLTVNFRSISSFRR